MATPDRDPDPTGPQLQDVDLTMMLRDELEALANIVRLDLRSAEHLHSEGEISDEELRWVFSDAERVRSEIIRREEGGW